MSKRDGRRPIPFWDRVDKNGPPPAHKPELGNCWLWTGAAGSGGRYGSVWQQGKCWQAHRFAWFLTHGSIEQLILHRCDIGLCVRPDHLYQGDQVQNMRDRDSQGRHGAWLHPERRPRGSRHGTKTVQDTVERSARGHARLSDEQVVDIRVRRAHGETLDSLADRYGVSTTTVHRAATGYGLIYGAIS